jgi:hypothetical protein
VALEDKSKEDLIKIVQTGHNLRNRADKRAARANEENAILREKLRKADILNRKLQLEIDSDPETLRERLRVAEERIDLIRQITLPRSSPKVVHHTADGPVSVQAEI